MYWNIREVVEVAGVINGADLDWDGGGALPDVLPVHRLEPVQLHDLLLALHPTFAVVTKPGKAWKGDNHYDGCKCYYLLMVLTAVSEMGGTGGNSRVVFQFITFL